MLCPYNVQHVCYSGYRFGNSPERQRYLLMKRLAFYLQYAAKNLLRSGQWTIFAVLCVAARVATVVALRSLGLAITDSLLTNLRQYNHGDVNISTVASFGPFA